MLLCRDPAFHQLLQKGAELLQRQLVQHGSYSSRDDLVIDGTLTIVSGIPMFALLRGPRARGDLQRHYRLTHEVIVSSAPHVVASSRVRRYSVVATAEVPVVRGAAHVVAVIPRRSGPGASVHRACLEIRARDEMHLAGLGNVAERLAPPQQRRYVEGHHVARLELRPQATEQRHLAAWLQPATDAAAGPHAHAGWSQADAAREAAAGRRA
mmetsp:Transcript_49140/g.126729  ORF Transcript_49140/g.126729 Transcript_49140/m.126729 type:complete len:211 (+) Transcript_49140:811-1443(+)